MAQQCSSPNQYFDGLLKACKPCHLRCPNGPPTCQRYCNNTSKCYSLNNPLSGWRILSILTIQRINIRGKMVRFSESKEKGNKAII